MYARHKGTMASPVSAFSSELPIMFRDQKEHNVSENPLSKHEFFFSSHSIFQVNTEFQRIITVQLEPKLVLTGSSHSQAAEGGALGERLKTEMELLKVQFIMKHASHLATCCFM